MASIEIDILESDLYIRVYLIRKVSLAIPFVLFTVSPSFPFFVYLHLENMKKN